MTDWTRTWHREGRADYMMDPERHTPIDPQGEALAIEQLKALGWRVERI